MTSFELLDAVNLRDVRTTGEVANALGVESREALRQLRAAESEGLVVEERDLSQNVDRDFDRQYWMLTPAGRARWEDLDSAREPQ